MVRGADDECQAVVGQSGGDDVGQRGLAVGCSAGQVTERPVQEVDVAHPGGAGGEQGTFGVL